jgi:Na+-driven multidrug efflux pump
MRALQMSVIRLFIFYVPLAWLGGQLVGVLGVFAGGLLANGFIAVIALTVFKRNLAQLQQQELPDGQRL